MRPPDACRSRSEPDPPCPRTATVGRAGIRSRSSASPFSLRPFPVPADQPVDQSHRPAQVCRTPEFSCEGNQADPFVCCNSSLCGCSRVARAPPPRRDDAVRSYSASLPDQPRSTVPPIKMPRAVGESDSSSYGWRGERRRADPTYTARQASGATSTKNACRSPFPLANQLRVRTTPWISCKDGPMLGAARLCLLHPLVRQPPRRPSAHRDRVIR